MELLPIIVFLPFACAAVALLTGRYLGKWSGLLMVGAAAASFVMALSLFLGSNAGHAGHAGDTEGYTQGGHAGETAVEHGEEHAVAHAGDHVADAGEHVGGHVGEHVGGDVGGPALYNLTWLEDAGTNLSISLRLQGDSFGLFFAMLVSGIGLLVGTYSLNYIDTTIGNGRVGRYYAALIAFMGSMLGIALADDLFMLFVFWEMTSITSFMLIGFWYGEDYAKKGAMTALQVTALGGLAMMAGFVLVGYITGTYQISELVSNTELQDKLMASPLLLPTLLLIFAGAFTKSAQWPFHFWLPGAMVAPTPVSTYLHAATMVKAGVFLIGRMLPIFGASVYWSSILVPIGLITFLYAAYQSLMEHDLKAILARTTLAALGMFMFLYGLKAGEQDALQIWNHAMYKAPLFLVAGIVEHATHSRDIRELGGLRKKMPITFVICCLGALSMAGLPPFFGFAAKESLYGHLLSNEVLATGMWQNLRWPIIGACVLANAFIFAVSWKLILGLFAGKETEKAHHAHEAGISLWGPAAVLGTIAIGMGLLATTGFTQSLVNNLSSAEHAHAHVTIIPDFSHPGPLVLSAITIALGITIYLSRRVVNVFQFAMAKVLPTMQSIWDRFMNTSTAIATAYSTKWQNGSLAWYMAATCIAFVVFSWIALHQGGLGLHSAEINMAHTPWYGAALCGLLGVAAIMVTKAETRLGGAITLTATGFLTSLVFVVYRSPDILLTQILIETVSTIFILLILFHMPSWKRGGPRPSRKLIDMTIAGAFGATMTLFVLLMTTPALRAKANLAGEYLSRTYTGGGGQNAVNVIIVDFRAIDTTGEIVVLVMVGLIAFGLLRSRRKNNGAIQTATNTVSKPGRHDNQESTKP